MKSKISTSDFSTRQTGSGQWKVTYTSPATGKQWTCETNDAEAVDVLRNAGAQPHNCEAPPTQKFLNALKSRCKAG